MAKLNWVQIVEEEFKLTAAKLGVTGREASALAHQWASPEATGLPMNTSDFIEDSARHQLPPVGTHQLDAAETLL